MSLFENFLITVDYDHTARKLVALKGRFFCESVLYV